MPRKKDPTREDMIRAEREIGENIPQEMLGLDTEDVGDAHAKDGLRASGRRPSTRP